MDLEHTSIIRTVLRRFADEKEIEKLGPRVYFANDVWEMVGTERRPTPHLEPIPNLESRELKQSASTLQQITDFADRFWKDLTELQRELLTVFAKLRGGDLRPELTPARWRSHDAPPGTMPDRQP